MKHDVHMYVTVRVKVTDIEAETHEEAILRAESVVGEFQRVYLRGEGYWAFPEIAYHEAEDTMTGALVDEHGDDNYERSCFYVPGGASESGWTKETE